jgi:polar amino acid transport system substrate-binding protein
MGFFKKLVTGLLVFSIFSVVFSSNILAADSTFERIKKTGVLRVAGMVGNEPYYHKDLKTGEWSGFCIEMSKDIAKMMNAKLEVVETTWGNSVLDLQAQKIDISFALNATPKRALVIDFTKPIFFNSFCIITREGFKAATWEDLNNPDVTIAIDIGSSHEQIARRYAPKAKIVGYTSRDEVGMAVVAKRADCFVTTVFLGLTALKKNPTLGEFIIPDPVISIPVNAGVRKEADKSFRDFVNVWADYNHSLGTTREWIIDALGDIDIKPADIPSEVQF